MAHHAFAGSYQQHGSSDTKKTASKSGLGTSSGKFGDQPVVFHKSIKSSGYGKEQPVLFPLQPTLLLVMTLQVMRMFGAKAPLPKKKPPSSTGGAGGLGAPQYDVESNVPVHRQMVDGWNERDRLHRYFAVFFRLTCDV